MTEETQKKPDLQHLKQSAKYGTLWTIAQYGVTQGLRFFSNLILTHLLFPELFGLMSLVSVVLMGLNLFSDIGVGTSIVRSKRGDDPDFLNTAWTLQVMRGFGLWLFSIAAAYPVAQLYEKPELIWLIPVVGFTSVISGFNSTGLFSSYRHIAIKQMALMGLASQILSLVVMITWAYISPSVWALVAGNIASSVSYTISTYFMVPGQTAKFRWDKTAVHELISFGKWIFISTALTFLAGQADRIILGKIFSLEILGIYTIALTLSDIPRQIVANLSGKIIFPVLSHLMDLPRDELRYQLFNTRRRVLMLLALGLAFMAAFGDLVILKLYDDRYEQAAWMFALLSIGIWPSMLSQTIDQVLFAIGKPRYIALANLFRFLFNVIGIPLGFYYFDILGAMTVIALNDLPFYIVIMFATHREGLSNIAQDIKTSLLFIAVLSVLWYARWALGFGSPIDTLTVDITLPTDMNVFHVLKEYI